MSMKLILITSPTFLPGEAEAIEACLSAGVSFIHLRKPEASESEVEALVRAIPPTCYDRLIVHDHFALQARFGLGGIHLNDRHPHPPVGYQGRLTRACHSLSEVAESQGHFDYVLLSPLFDSISKQGYRAAYTPEALVQARQEGIIDERVVALGGISLSRLPQVRQWGFGGAALLGDVWGRYHTPADLPAVTGHLRQLLHVCHHT